MYNYSNQIADYFILDYFKSTKYRKKLEQLVFRFRMGKHVV